MSKQNKAIVITKKSFSNAVRNHTVPRNLEYICVISGSVEAGDRQEAVRKATSSLRNKASRKGAQYIFETKLKGLVEEEGGFLQDVIDTVTGNAAVDGYHPEREWVTLNYRGLAYKLKKR